MRLVRLGAVLVLVAAIAPSALRAPAAAAEPGIGDGGVRLVPETVAGVGNCVPLANNVLNGFSGFIYRNVPPFRLSPGDEFAFDLGGTTIQDVRRNIYFAPTDRNPFAAPGGTGVRALAWTRMAADTQLPRNPRGNAVVGDYELVFRADSSFDFAGGGLAVGFGGSPPGPYADGGCEQVLVHTNRLDPSGHFFARFYRKADRTLAVLDDAQSDGIWLVGLVVKPRSEPPMTTAAATPEPNGAGWNSTPVQVDLKATDDRDGVTELHYRIDAGPDTTVPGPAATVEVTGDGMRTVAYRAVDADGNAEAWRELVLRIDTVPPAVVADVTPGGDWTTGPVTVRWSATDDGSGVAACDGPTVVSAPGVVEVTGSCTDVAGNTGRASSVVGIARAARIDVSPGAKDTLVSRAASVIVAVLSGSGFDATSTDVSTLRFGVTGTEPTLIECLPSRDADGDGLADLVCRFDPRLSGLGGQDGPPNTPPAKPGASSQLYLRGVADGIPYVASVLARVLPAR